MQRIYQFVDYISEMPDGKFVLKYMHKMMINSSRDG